MRTTLGTIVAFGSVVAFSFGLVTLASAGESQPVQGKVAAQPAAPARTVAPVRANLQTGGSDFWNSAPFVSTPVVSLSNFDLANPYAPGQFFPLSNAPYIAPVYEGYTHQWGGVGNGAWNGQEALGLANNVGGTPMGAYGMASISGGGSRTIAGPLGQESMAGRVGTPSIAGGGNVGSVQGKIGSPLITGSGAVGTAPVTANLGAPSIAATRSQQSQGSRPAPAQSTQTPSSGKH